MSQLKDLTNIGTADIIGTIIAAGFWFYLAILISPESYGELFYLLSITGIVSYLTLIGSKNTITVYLAKKIQIQSTFNFISLIGALIGFIILFLIFDRIDIGFLVIGYTINNLVIGELF
jgi:O-antigen/teichoic acid export membrane protein